MIPNYLSDVYTARDKYPEAWSHAHVEGDPRRLEWIKLFAKDLHAKDSTCYLNGKRGNPLDLSADAINILCDKADSAGRTPGGLACVVVDVIGSAGARPPYNSGNPAPYPVWGVYNTLIEGSGAPVDPNNVPGPPSPIVIQPYPDEPSWWGAVFTPAVQQCYRDAGRPFPDPKDDSVTLDGFRHWSRTSYDIRDGMTKEAALVKRIAELRKELGLK